MTDKEAIAWIVEFLEGQFPKTCPNCQRRFSTLRDFFLHTQPSGQPVSFDLESGHAGPPSPGGTIAYSLCVCGATIALSADAMSRSRLWSLLEWAKSERERRGMDTRDFLQEVRLKIRQLVIAKTE